MFQIHFTLHTVPIPIVILSSSGPIQNATVGSEFAINCTVSTVSGVESSVVTISWMGPGGGSIIKDSRITISPTTSSGNNYTSSLRFSILLQGDKGSYICNVIILNTVASQSVELQSFICKLLLCVTLKIFTGICSWYTKSIKQDQAIGIHINKVRRVCLQLPQPFRNCSYFFFEFLSPCNIVTQYILSLFG